MKASTREWVAKAEEDFAVATILARPRKRPPWYHAIPAACSRNRKPSALSRPARRSGERRASVLACRRNEPCTIISRFRRPPVGPAGAAAVLGPDRDPLPRRAGGYSVGHEPGAIRSTVRRHLSQAVGRFSRLEFMIASRGGPYLRTNASLSSSSALSTDLTISTVGWFAVPSFTI